MRKINYRPEERTPYFLSIYNHDDRFPCVPRSWTEIATAAQQLRYWAEYLVASDKASLENAAEDIVDDVIRVREDVIQVSLVIGLPVGGELTTPGMAIPI
jgi:hypothetical protein